MAERRVLPKDFIARLQTDSVEELIAVYDELLPAAYQPGDRRKRNALHFGRTPLGLAEWLVGQGVDPNIPDASGVPAIYDAANARGATAIRNLARVGADVNLPLPVDTSYGPAGRTALHRAAQTLHPENVEALVALGADADVRDRHGVTPLSLALDRCDRIDTEAVARMAEALVGAGAVITDEMRARVTAYGVEQELLRLVSDEERSRRIGEQFARLAAVFGVPMPEPAGPHDGISPIVVPHLAPQAQQRVLWRVLVPAHGPALTAQGEAVRIVGRVAVEILDMGGINWDGEYRSMVDALPTLLRSGEPLPPERLEKSERSIASLRRGTESRDTRRFLGDVRDLVLDWVKQNPLPIPLPKSAYAR